MFFFCFYMFDGEEYSKSKFSGGNHLITQIKWTLNRNELRTNLKVVKDSLMNNIVTRIQFVFG